MSPRFSPTPSRQPRGLPLRTSFRDLELLKITFLLIPFKGIFVTNQNRSSLYNFSHYAVRPLRQVTVRAEEEVGGVGGEAAGREDAPGAREIKKFVREERARAAEETFCSSRKYALLTFELENVHHDYMLIRIYDHTSILSCWQICYQITLFRDTQMCKLSKYNTKLWKNTRSILEMCMILIR